MTGPVSSATSIKPSIGFHVIPSIDVRFDPAATNRPRVGDHATCPPAPKVTSSRTVQELALLVTTVIAVLEFTVPEVAVTVVVPGFNGVAKPFDPKALLTLITLPELDAGLALALQVTADVRFCVVPLE